MNWAKPLALLVAALALLTPTPAPAQDTPPAPSPKREIAITIDDLPWATMGEETPATLAQFHPRLIAAMKAAEAPVTGFVNEGKLVSGGKVDTSRVHLLKDWLDAGLDLGNHTYAHADLHAVGLEEYEADILRGEVFLRPLLAERDQAPRWFRHPYLRAGRSAADKAAGRLQKRRKQYEWTEENGEGKRLDFIATGRPGRGRSTRSGEVVAFARQLDRILAKQKASSSDGSQS